MQVRVCGMLALLEVVSIKLDLRDMQGLQEQDTGQAAVHEQDCSLVLILYLLTHALLA